jgi:hypothetical protein
MAAHQARDVVEEKIPGLAAKMAAVKRQWVATEEQSEGLVHKLTLLSCVCP